jgi:hypothetical protein
VESQQIASGFLDESSTLRQPERYFIVALVAVNNPRAALWPRIVKRARAHLGKNRQALGELKFDKSDDRTRQFLLTELARKQSVEVTVTGSPGEY